MSDRVFHFIDISIQVGQTDKLIRLQIPDEHVDQLYEGENFKFNIIKHTETVVEESILDRDVESKLRT